MECTYLFAMTGICDAGVCQIRQVYEMQKFIRQDRCIRCTLSGKTGVWDAGVYLVVVFSNYNLCSTTCLKTLVGGMQGHAPVR